MQVTCWFTRGDAGSQVTLVIVGGGTGGRTMIEADRVPLPAEFVTSTVMVWAPGDANVVWKVLPSTSAARALGLPLGARQL